MITVEIPGGEAVLRSQSSELSPRRRRPLELLGTRIGKKIEAASAATRLLCDGDVIDDNSETFNEDGSLKFPGGDVDLTEKELGLFARFNDALAWALLKSWTLDIPIPGTPDEFLDIPSDVFDALRIKAAEVNAALAAEQESFTVDAIEDTASPTGASVE